MREFPGDVPRQQRNDSFRAGHRLHRLSERRVASRRAPYLLTKIEDADGRDSLSDRKRAPAFASLMRTPAYQVHYALSQDLKVGRGGGRGGTPSEAEAHGGSGGKPGTSYNFTDALFAGYNSDVTCAVWTGFDKPVPIYRGAFGSQLAMPVWVNVMNAAAEYMPARDMPPPRSLKKVEICTRSGDLATDRCFEMIDGERRRTTFTTYATAGRDADPILPGPRWRPHPGGHRGGAAEHGGAGRAGGECRGVPR